MRVKEALAFAVVLWGLCGWRATADMTDFRIDCGFPGGNIIVERIEGDTIALRQDRRDTEGYWFYWCFRVRGADGRTLTFNFTDGKPVGVRGPAVSLDEGVTWTWLGKDKATQTSFAYAVPADAREVRFSFGMTYTEANWARFIARVGKHPALTPGVLCKSRKGRPVEMARVGRLDGAAQARVAVAARHHCCEMMASYAVEGLIEGVLADDETGRWLSGNVEFLIVPFADKDGVEDGDQGKNRRPRDHGRDYDENPIYPEAKALRALLPGWGGGRCMVALDLHCPGPRGQWAEHIYQVGKKHPGVWAEQQRFGRMLQAARQGPLAYEAGKDLPFGEAWNTPDNFTKGEGFSTWAATVPGVRLSTGFELPYANASGAEVNAASARAFGRDLARALNVYLLELLTPPPRRRISRSIGGAS